jgi:hypothetical protein
LSLIQKAVKDFLSKEFLLFVFVPYLFSFIVIFVAVYLCGINLAESINIFGTSFSDTVASLLAGIMGIVGVFLFSSFLSIAIIGIFTPFIVKKIYKKYYSFFQLSKTSMIAYYKEYFSIIAKTFGFFLVLLPLYFIPFVNLFLFHLPLFYLFWKTLTIDVGGEIFSKYELEYVVKNRKATFLKYAVFLYLLSTLPFIGVFVQLFNIILFTHLFFENKK